MEIEISNQYKNLIDPEAATILCLQTIKESQQFPIEDGELSIVFVDDQKIAEIHDAFMGDPSPTDVITFPAEIEMGSAGEIIVSVDHAINRAAELDLPFTHELTLYLLHGWLHLAGYDDRDEQSRKAMREAEQIALALVAPLNQCYQLTLG